MMEELDLPNPTIEDIDQQPSGSDDTASIWSCSEDSDDESRALNLLWELGYRAERQCADVPRYGLTPVCIDYLMRAYPVYFRLYDNAWLFGPFDQLLELFATDEEKKEVKDNDYRYYWDRISWEPPTLEFVDTWAENVMEMMDKSGVVDYWPGTDSNYVELDKWCCYVALKRYGDKQGIYEQDAHPANGLKIALTGIFPNMTRKQVTEAVLAAGGRVLGSVSKECDLLVVGENPGSKLAVARKLGIRCVTPQALLILITQNGSLPDELPMRELDYPEWMDPKPVKTDISSDRKSSAFRRLLYLLRGR